MKSMLQLLATAVPPLCCGLALHAQDTLPNAPTPAPPPAVDVAGQRYPDAQKPYDAARFQNRLQRIVRTSATGSHPTIIRSASMDPKDQATLEEDLAVMAHILNKALDELPGNRPLTAMGIDVFGAQGPAALHTVYLDGYGALFTANVGFPLLAPPSAPEEKKEESPAGSTWEEAKQELYGPPPGALPGAGPTEEFSAEKVNKLTDSLLDALKNATNIRGLKPGDWVTVCVLGAAPLPGTPPHHRPRAIATSAPATPGVHTPGVVALLGTPGPQSGTVMTLRARKSDIDAFAKGKLTLDEFRKQASIEKYEHASARTAGTGLGVGGWGGMGGGGLGTGYGTPF